MADSVSRVITEIVNGDALTMGQAAKLIPAHRGDGTATPSSIWRWATQGAKAGDGRLVKLEVAQFGGRHLTSKAAIARFAAALSSTSADTTRTSTPKKRTAAQRKAAAAESHKRLEAAGA